METQTEVNTKPQFDLTGLVAVVTGGSRGLGRADCLALARNGADVVVTDILIEGDPELQKTAESANSVLAQVFTAQNVVFAERTSHEIREMGRRSAAIKMDVTNVDQVHAVMQQIRDEFGRIDILVNNAGTLDHVAKLENQSDDLWARDLKVNLTGSYNCAKAAWPHMKENGYGRIINMASVAGTLGGFGQASYSTTKAGLIGLTKTLAIEGARQGITANAIVPGIIASEAWKMGNPEMNERMVQRTAFKAPGEPADIAAAITFLCSREAKYITGQTLTVAGGIDLFVF
ncbi:MAG: SDR family NAD(P)-dependent oxidoreductase [Candidatus Dormibacteria bacterium]